MITHKVVIACDWCGNIAESAEYLREGTWPNDLIKLAQPIALRGTAVQGQHFCSDGCQRRFEKYAEEYNTMVEIHRQREDRMLHDIPAFPLLRGGRWR